MAQLAEALRYKQEGHGVLFFIDIILPGSTQTLTKISKGGRCVGVTNLPRSCADCREIWEP